MGRAFTQVLLICPKVDEFKFRLVFLILKSNVFESSLSDEFGVVHALLGNPHHPTVRAGGCSCRKVLRYATTLARGKTSPRSKSISSRFTSCMISHRSPTASQGTITRKLSVASRQVA